MGKGIFLEAVERVFKGWEALRMAVDNSFGGADSIEKAEWMIEVTGEFMWDNWPVSVDEVEDYVSTIMDQEFDTILEDGSLSQISKQLCDLRQVCLSGSSAAVEQYFSQNIKPLSSHPSLPQPTSDPDTSGCAETMEKLKLEGGDSEEAPEAREEESVKVEDGAVVDDGWTVVSKGKRKQR